MGLPGARRGRLLAAGSQQADIVADPLARERHTRLMCSASRKGSFAFSRAAAWVMLLWLGCCVDCGRDT